MKRRALVFSFRSEKESYPIDFSRWNKRYITDHYFAASSQTGAAPGAQIISLLINCFLDFCVFLLYFRVSLFAHPKEEPPLGLKLYHCRIALHCDQILYETDAMLFAKLS